MPALPDSPIELISLLVFSGSLLLFIYCLNFTRKNYQKIYTHLFLFFLIPSFFRLIFGVDISPAIFFVFSLSIFTLFILTIYGDKLKNPEYFYFLMILVYAGLSGFLYLLNLSPETLFVISNFGLFPAFALTLQIAGMVWHFRIKSTKQYLFYSYLAAAAYSVTLWLPETQSTVLGQSLILVLFFFFHFLLARQELYLPLLSKIDTLTKETQKMQADLPEQIREKFQILEHNKAKLMELTQTDKMTGVFNKGKLMALLKEMTDNPRSGKFSVLMFDIDNFKTINDTMGHLIGDECIIRLARIGESSIRRNDHLGRYGGDEFMMILPTLEAMDAKIIAERFRAKVAKETDPRFTISIGIASYPEDGKTPKELIEWADKALYLSKERGKNKVSHHKLF